jgi:tetratricopeptide (TPR) repeat protein
MDFRRSLIILAVFLMTVIIAQPALSAGNVTDIISNNTAGNVTKVILNQTSDLEKDLANQNYNWGVQSLNIGDYEHAVSYFDSALAQNLTMMKKTDALLYLYQNKAYSQIQLRNYTGAVATANDGLKEYPKDPLLWNNKGYALSLLGKNEDALVAYTSAISFDGNYTNAYINQGDVLSEMGRYKEAIAAYSRANETDPFNIAASDGLVAARKGDAQAGQTTTILMIVVLVAAAGIVLWYVKFRKPAEPAPEEKKKRSRKKE